MNPVTYTWDDSKDRTFMYITKSNNEKILLENDFIVQFYFFNINLFRLNPKLFKIKLSKTKKSLTAVDIKDSKTIEIPLPGEQLDSPNQVDWNKLVVKSVQWRLISRHATVFDKYRGNLILMGNEVMGTQDVKLSDNDVVSFTDLHHVFYDNVHILEVHPYYLRIENGYKNGYYHSFIVPFPGLINLTTYGRDTRLIDWTTFKKIDNPPQSSWFSSRKPIEYSIAPRSGKSVATKYPLQSGNQPRTEVIPPLGNSVSRTGNSAAPRTGISIAPGNHLQNAADTGLGIFSYLSNPYFTYN
jgi:hypothetical protein